MRMKKAIYINFLITCFIVSCALIRPDGKCKVESLLLQEDDFPAGTIVNDVRSPIVEMPEESAGFTASYGGSAIYHEVSRFPRTTSAENEFDGARTRASVQTDSNGPWETPPELSFSSSIFQEYYVTCGKVNNKYQCRMIGQYDEYYMFFSVNISDTGVTLELLNGLLQKIDARVGQCLQK